MLAVVTGGLTALPRGAEPQCFLQGWCQSGKGAWTTGGLCWQDMKVALTLLGCAVPIMVAEEGGTFGPQSHPLPSTSHELSLLLPSAGGIHDVPHQGRSQHLK